MQVVVAKKYLCRKRIFGCHYIDPAENAKCPDRDVVRMSDGDAYKKEGALRLFPVASVEFRWASLLTPFSSHRYNSLLIPQDTFHCLS